MTTKMCQHDALTFRSGAYYLQCDTCGEWWVARTRDADIPDHFRGPTGLSGQRRTAAPIEVTGERQDGDRPMYCIAPGCPPVDVARASRWIRELQQFVDSFDAASPAHVTPYEMLHILRNPQGWSDDAIRGARLRAADLIETQQKELKRDPAGERQREIERLRRMLGEAKWYVEEWRTRRASENRSLYGTAHFLAAIDACIAESPTEPERAK